MAVVVEVADDRDSNALFLELLHDMRHAFGGGIIVHSHADQLRARTGERRDLLHRRKHVGRVGVGHRLHHYWCIATDPNPADIDGYSLPALDSSHGEYSV